VSILCNAFPFLTGFYVKNPGKNPKIQIIHPVALAQLKKSIASEKIEIL
jgi:hypothetical protein